MSAACRRWRVALYIKSCTVGCVFGGLLCPFKMNRDEFVEKCQFAKDSSPGGSGCRDAWEQSWPHRPSCREGEGTRRRGTPPYILGQLPSLQGVWGIRSRCVDSPDLRRLGSIASPGRRPDSATLCCPLSPSWQLDRGIYSSTTQPAGTPDSRRPPPARGGVSHNTDAVHHIGGHRRDVEAHRLMENGVPPLPSHD
jgi:hypothetical protein